MMSNVRSWFWISPDERRKPVPWPILVLNWMLALLLLALVCFYSFSRLSYNWNWGTVAGYSNFFWRGWWNTLGISALALVLSVLIGLVAALARRSGLLVLRALSRLYVEVVRGTPLGPDPGGRQRRGAARRVRLEARRDRAAGLARS